MRINIIIRMRMGLHGMKHEAHFARTKAFREERDLGNHGGVGHHHGNGSEHGLQVVGQFGAPRIAGIHCDEDAAGPDQIDHPSLEHKANVGWSAFTFGHGGECREDCQNLLGHDRQHFNVDSEIKETEIA